MPQLEERLARNPGDMEGWRMLGRSYLVMGRAGEAATAYERASAMSGGKDPGIELDLAEALVLAGDPGKQARAKGIIDAALGADETNQKALWYAGLMAARANDVETAKARWSRLLETDVAAKTGLGMARAIAYQSREPEARVYPDRNWEYAIVGGSHEFLKNGARNLDARTLWHFTAICVTPAMVNKIVGAGSQYLGAYVDKDGDYLDGGQTYQLHLPPNIPINNFWSVIAYDNQTRSFLQTDQTWPSVTSKDKDFHVNEDGSVDVYFAPERPKDARNFIRTIPGKGWNAIFRLYGPLEPWFDKSWRLGEIEPVE